MHVLIKEGENGYRKKQVDQDGLWKKIIGELFDDFLLFFTPELYEQINFKQEPIFLDKELFQEVVDEKKGRRYADRLAKVQLKNGQEKWILIHVEVQSSNENEFSKRMFQYFYRIYDMYEEEIVAIAVHTSLENIHQMKKFKYNYFGTELSYSYNNYKIENYTDEDLVQSENIFSKVVFAAKAMNRMKNEDEKRYRFKRTLMKELVHSQKYSRTAIIAVLYFIDYLLQLPEELTERLSKEIGPAIRKEQGLMELYNEENASPTILRSFAEQWDEGVEKGRAEGLERGLKQGISLEKKKIAKKLKAEKMPKEMIAEVTGLSLDEVEAL